VKLEEKGYQEQDIYDTLAFLQKQGYLNDEEYAMRYAESHAARGQGFYRIRQGLRERGIDEELAEQVLAQLPEPNNAIQKILHQKLNKQNDENTRRKAAAALSRRGFAWDDINAALDDWSE